MSERNKQTALDFYEAGLNQKDFPDLKAEVKRLFADGDHVIAHVCRPVPESAANRKGMF